MARRALKKESSAKYKQPSRNIRDELFEFIEGRVAHDRDWIDEEFKGGDVYCDDDSTPGVVDLFRRSGLDMHYAGHWQYLLVTVVGFLWPNWTRVTNAWSSAQCIDFLKDLIRQRGKSPDASNAKLCALLKEDDPAGYPAEAESLRIQLQKILRDLKNRVSDGTATEEEAALLQAFPDRRRRRSAL